jgi:hypothetical protein
MTIEERMLDYVAEKVLHDFKTDVLPDDVAQLVSKRPWIGAVRERANADCLGRISSVLDSPNTRPRLTDFALNIARCLHCPEVVPAVWTTFTTVQDLGLRISAMLLLAAKGEMEGKWESELPRIGADKRKLLDVSMTFYACNTLNELATTIRTRVEKYPYSRPYYDFLLRTIGETGDSFQV